MSSASDAAAIVALFNSLSKNNFCGVAASILFMYDAVITLDREVASFWTAKRSGASLLFFANKWCFMMVTVMMFVDLAPFRSDRSCFLAVMVMQVFKILQLVPAAAFSALRAYVLSRSKILGILVCVLSLAPVGVNLVFYGYQLSGMNIPFLGCVASDNTSITLNLRLVFVSRVPLIAADVLLIYITWTKLRRWGALRDIRQSKSLSLSDVLFRGGNIYFVLLFTLNSLHLAFSLTAMAGSSAATGDISNLTAFTAPLTAIIISRFLLELQDANQMVVRLDDDDPSRSSRDPYDSKPSFISSLGGFVNPALSAQSDSDVSFEPHVRSRFSEAGEEEGEVHAPE